MVEVGQAFEFLGYEKFESDEVPSLTKGSYSAIGYISVFIPVSCSQRGNETFVQVAMRKMNAAADRLTDFSSTMEVLEVMEDLPEDRKTP